MSDPERPDAPNQQVVRPDGSHPSQEGTGGGQAPKAKAKAKKKDDEPKPEEGGEG